MSVELSIKGRNCMGTLEVTLKAGNMRKAAGFTAYPRSADASEGDPLRLQSDNRVALLFPNRRLVLSDALKGHPGFHSLNIPWVKKFEAAVDTATMEQVRASLAATASAKAGTNGLIYCDNSKAGNF